MFKILIMLMLIILPEIMVFAIVYYFRNNGASPTVMFLYLIPITGSILPFIMLRKAKNMLVNLKSYLNVTGISMISLFYNSTALLMWKLGAKLLWLLPIFIVEPVIGIIYYAHVKRVES